MIGYIEGSLIINDGERVIVKTQFGVGYSINFVTPKETGLQLALFISHIIKENEQSLYGFETVQDKDLFEILIKVNKVGPKMAFSLISFLGADQICQAILIEDVDILKQVKGVGKAAASQLILSLKEKIGSIYLEKYNLNILGSKTSDPSLLNLKPEQSNMFEDAKSALVQLGFNQEQIIPLLNENIHQYSSTEDLIKSVLKKSM